MGTQLVDFMNVIGLPRLLKEHIHIEKRQSLYSPDKLSQFMILQNLLGYDRIEGSRPLDQDTLLKEKLNIQNYPDPETFRDELSRYSQETIEELSLVNQRLLDILCKLTEPRYVDLHFDSKVITVYGDQENAKEGYNPHKHGWKSYHLKVCTVEPFGLILAIFLEPGNHVSATDFVGFYKKCLAVVRQNHLVIQNVRLDRGFFSEDNIEAFEGSYIFFEVVAKQYNTIKQWISEYIPEDDFKPFYPDQTVFGASFRFRLDTWNKPRDFIAVKKLMKHEDNGQGILFPKWRYQVICHNQLDMSTKEVWEDYNKRARIELNIRDLDYDHFITKVPTGNFLSNFAYFWHCVLSYNLALIFKTLCTSGTMVKSPLINASKKTHHHTGKACKPFRQNDHAPHWGFPIYRGIGFYQRTIDMAVSKIKSIACLDAYNKLYPYCIGYGAQMKWRGMLSDITIWFKRKISNDIVLQVFIFIEKSMKYFFASHAR